MGYSVAAKTGTSVKTELKTENEFARVIFKWYNDNDILDPINNSYRNVNLNIEEELENTLLDRFLNSNDNYVD